MNEIEKLSDEQLIADARELHELIFEIDCFGVKDLVRYELTLRELDMRDYSVSQKLVIEK